MKHLPGVLARIAEAAGQQAALTLAREVGGTEISIPSRPRARSPLAKMIGLDAARAIAAHVGHGRVLIPMAGLKGQAGRRAACARLQAQGLSATKAAIAADVHERTAWRARRRVRNPARLPLFDAVTRRRD